MFKKLLKTLFVMMSIACLAQNFQAQPQKAGQVNKLIDLTFAPHPYVGIDAQIAALPVPRDTKEFEETAKKQRVEVFEDALKTNNK